MKLLLLIEDESTNRGGYATIPPLENIPEEIAAKLLMNAYREALSNLNATPAGNDAKTGVIDLFLGIVH